MFNYCRYCYQKQSVELVSADKTEWIEASSLNSWFEKLCIEFGSTLQGRKKAYSTLMKQKKFLPVIICLDPVLILIPLAEQKNDDVIYISYSQIETIHPYERTEYSLPVRGLSIIFHDHQKLDAEPAGRISYLLEQMVLYLRIEQMKRKQLKRLSEDSLQVRD